MKSKIGFFLIVASLIFMMIVLTTKGMSQMAKTVIVIFCFFIMAFGVILQTDLIDYFVEKREEEQYA